FERSTPHGTTATAELSTAGAGGPWTAVTDGAAVAIAQQTYHLRLTLNATADRRTAPGVTAAGVEFLTPVDASAEAIVEPLAQQIEIPYLAAGIGEGAVTLVRTGRRDYHDVGSDLVAGAALPQLEVVTRLGSRHPRVPRDQWLTIDRALVNTRDPSPTGERLSLLSYLKLTKTQIPARQETINSVHTVTAATTGA